MNLLTIIVIAISLSMDAFSLSLAYGTLNISKKNIYILSIIVGIYHFFMPIIGNFFGNIIIDLINIKQSIVVFIVLFFIGINMIFESFKNEKKEKILTVPQMLLFGLAVSIDSFSVGIGIIAITDMIIISAFTFATTSLMFTYLGLNLGKRINYLIGKMSTIIGGLSLIIIGLIYLMDK